jgi:hypothetical protein
MVGFHVVVNCVLHYKKYYNLQMTIIMSVALGLALTIVINCSHGVMLQIVGPLTDDSRRIIYDCNKFIVQATL